MLTDEDFKTYCQKCGLSDQAQAILHRVRSSPPARRVRSAAGNVSVRYPSRKMGRVIQAESHRVELAGIHEMEHDPATLEYFDQPQAIKLTYPDKHGRTIGVLHTPDFLVMRSESAGWEEWKMEEELVRLAEKMPHRYLRDENGTWRCPPGESVATPLGLYYRVRSSAQIDWVFQRNVVFFEDYWRRTDLHASDAARAAILALVTGTPGMLLRDLLAQATPVSSDEIYSLLSAGDVYVDLRAAPLAEPERVHVFRDRETAVAWALLHATSHSDSLRSTHVVEVAVGARVLWDSRAWTIMNVGETTTTLMAEGSALVELPNAHFQTLVTQGKLVGVVTPPDREIQNSEARERLYQASPADLQEANRRYAIIKPVLEGHPYAELSISPHTASRWVARYRKAEQKWGAGYVGLLPSLGGCGNFTPRLPPQTRALIEQFVQERYETLVQPRKSAVYGELVLACQAQGLVAPSYRTFAKAVNQRPRYEQQKKRAGRRAAYVHEPLYWELTLTTPRHGDRPFEIGHIDHTELDLELVDSQTGRNLGRPWATFLADAFSRRLLAVYVTFDVPSYRSCMMILRECVRRHGRLPQTVVVDGGKEFGSIYFETLLARYECTKKTRPAAKPRYGAVLERLFGTANTEFLYNLTGNTQITKNVRQVTKAVDPKQLAAWTLAALYARLCDWAYDVYDTTDHPALGQTPREAYAQGLAQSGARAQRLIPYDEDFIMATLPSTRKGTATVRYNMGVKINGIYYWADALRDPQVEQTAVQVRYDPYDAGHAYVFVKGHWVRCVSEHYARLHGRSEREIQLVTAELRKRQQQHLRGFQLTAAKLAAFTVSVETEEAILLQRRQDAESRAILTLGWDPRPMAGTGDLPASPDGPSPNLPALGTDPGQPGVEPPLSGRAASDDIYEDY